MRPRRLMSAAALVLVTAGCTTFTDDNVAARVGDAELSHDELDERIGSFGLPDGERTPAVLARETLSTWIQEQAIEQELFSEDVIAGIDAADVAARYDAGIDTAGVTCPSILVTETIAAADAALARIDAGESFADVFAEVNIDPGLAASGGQFQCVRAADLAPEVRDTPDVQALFLVGETVPAATAELTDPTGAPVNGLLIAFRPYESLADDELLFVDQVIRPQIAVEGIDVYVDARYGRFDATSGTVVAVG